MDLAFIVGMMEGSMKGYGRIIKCLGWGVQYGRMERNIMGSMLMIKRKAKARLNGRMGRNMLEIGFKGNNMEKAFLLMQRVRKGKVFGKMERGLNGLKNEITNLSAFLVY